MSKYWELSSRVKQSGCLKLVGCKQKVNLDVRVPAHRESCMSSCTGWDAALLLLLTVLLPGMPVWLRRMTLWLCLWHLSQLPAWLPHTLGCVCTHPLLLRGWSQTSWSGTHKNEVCYWLQNNLYEQIIKVIIWVIMPSLLVVIYLPEQNLSKSKRTKKLHIM